jgi:hypothetical protein
MIGLGRVPLLNVPPDGEEHVPLTATRIRELLATRDRYTALAEHALGRRKGAPPADDLPGGLAACAADWSRLGLLRHFVPDPATPGAGERLRTAREAMLRWGEGTRALPHGAFLRARLESVTQEELETIFALEQELAVLDPPSPARAHEVRDGDPEAREWLASAGPAPLAGNRFADAVEAIAFVDALYAAGAARVVIASEKIRREAEGLYADALRVALPADVRTRRAVLMLVNREVREEGFTPYRDQGQPSVLLWWD